MKTTTVFGFTLLFATFPAVALTISRSGEEVRYEYEFEYRSLATGERALSKPRAKSDAEAHAAHLYGLFHAPEGAEKFGDMYPELNEGFAGTKKAEVIDATSFVKENDEHLWVKYRARGTMLVQKPVLRNWLNGRASGTVELKMLQDMPAIYDESIESYAKGSDWKPCTDGHYTGAADFSYFWNQYKCPALGKKPIAAPITLKITKVNPSAEAARHDVPLARLHAANGNGRLVTLYFVNGFDSVPRSGTTKAVIHRDAAWKTYAATAELLEKKYGFERIGSLDGLRRALGNDVAKISLQTNVSEEHDKNRVYFSTFVKTTDEVTYVARLGLFDAHNEGNTNTFPRFWKEAWENGDFIYFGGHSGDGQSLNLKDMLAVLTKDEIDRIDFKSGKTQIAFLDACSSYAHYQDFYAKRNKNLHLITNGLVSLFHLADETIDALIDTVTAGSDTSIKWVDALETIEKKQLEGHVRELYYERDWASELNRFTAEKAYPSYLVNVRIGD